MAMLEERGLILPPERQPLHGLWRGTLLNGGKETLHEVRRALAWRYLIRKALHLRPVAKPLVTWARLGFRGTE